MAARECDPAPFLAALADPTRLRLIRLLSRQPAERALCVNALAYRLGVSQPAVSQHLRVLRNLGLVRADRRGRRVHYVLDRPRYREWRQAVLEALRLPEEAGQQGMVDRSQTVTDGTEGEDAGGRAAQLP